MLRAVKTGTRVRIFALTWLSYAGYYLTRKNFSVAKTDVQDAHGLSKQELAHIDTGYLAAYAVGQVVWGFVADRVGARRVLTVGMLATAGLSVAFGQASSLAAFTMIWLLNGLAQGSGWSPNVKAMTPVPPEGLRGVIMGWWSTNYVVGGLVASPIAAWALRLGGIAGAFTYPAIVVAVVGLAILVLLPDTQPAGTPPREIVEARRAARDQVLRSTRVWILGASYFFMKLIRYAFLFWAVYYGEKVLGYGKAKAVAIALAFEIGGAFGSIGVGFLSDRLLGGRRFPVGIGALGFLAAALAAYGPVSALGEVPNALCLAAIGFFLFGPDSILCGTAAQELGGPAGAAVAAGIINGMGSVGPILGSELWTGFSSRYGWNAAFVLLGGMALAAGLILLPLWNIGAPRRS